MGVVYPPTEISRLGDGKSSSPPYTWQQGGKNEKPDYKTTVGIFRARHTRA